MTGICIYRKSPVKKNKIIITSSVKQKKSDIKNSQAKPKLSSLKNQSTTKNKKISKTSKVSNIFEIELENCFKNLSKNTFSKKNLSKLKVPQKIIKLNAQVISSDNIFDDNYEKKLINYLQKSLELPKIGSVKAEITIDNTGKITKLKILESENNENLRYLKNQLHRLIYPCFNSNEFDQITKSYIINFNNLR